jgi:hypothetical protein
MALQGLSRRTFGSFAVWVAGASVLLAQGLLPSVNDVGKSNRRKDP